MSYNVSLLVGLKNNLDYSKHFYATTRALYPDVEIVFVSYNSTDGTHEWLDSLDDKNLIAFHSAENKTFAQTYNKCTELATRPYVTFAHNDVVLTPGFIQNILQHAGPQNVVYYTTIEPPIFSDHVRPGKIVKDFGESLDNLRLNDLYSFAEETSKRAAGTTHLDDVSFFLCADRDKLLKIGGLDPLFKPMFCEDDDLLLRLKLSGLKFFTALDAIAYHFVSKTSRFSAEYQATTKRIEVNSNRNFVRKWGFANFSPVKKRYDIGFCITNMTDDLLYKLEPWCSTLYTDFDCAPYIANEQPNTAFALADKIKPYDAPKTNGVLIAINGEIFNHKSYHVIENLSKVITEHLNSEVPLLKKIIGETKTSFKHRALKFEVQQSTTHEAELIYNYRK
ncbi:hypothetical protein A0256_07965 [Mucilaginibacter sp. PAMC 26640]|nr:hypothetical protein A0256_07965 [Mucilaginibacter sp. PAMC 26640]